MSPSVLPPPNPPLATGTSAPNVPLVSEGRTVLPDDLREQTTVLVFASAEWNPARAEQMTQFYNALVQAAAVPDAPTDSLVALQNDGMRYDMHFEGASAPVPLVVLPEIDSRSEAARAYGVYDRQAVFVVDGAGIVRFQHVTEGTSPSIGALVDALRDIHCPPTGQTDAASPLWRASRRDFIAAALAGAFALTLGGADSAEARQTANPQKALAGTLPVTLKVNGKSHALNLDPRVTLLDALRENIGPDRSKKGCDHGQCGACTVHIDGHSALSCLSLAAQGEGTEIVTIEGLAKGDTLHPVQQAFLDHDGYQCGYCTPGQILSAVALIRTGGAKTDREIREGMSGNLCRCAAVSPYCGGGEGCPRQRQARLDLALTLDPHPLVASAPFPLSRKRAEGDKRKPGSENTAFVYGIC